ncbi:MAG: class I SAM-dependent methyltransferase [Chitinophagaceae bacterium]
MRKRPGNGFRYLYNNPLEIWKQFISTSIFNIPGNLPVSAWTEHIPFAFWLTEASKPAIFVELGTHYGLSYFSFCKAVESAGLATKCFAIDSWAGDEHAGFYDNSVFDAVKEMNKPYNHFSTLCRQPFDLANSCFENKSIDLLHIDGLHTYEAVKHDFYKWLPKMSEKGIVLLHDTFVVDRGFGVYKLWEELRQQYPSFEFVHGYGLGLVGTGGNIPKKIAALFNIPPAHNARLEIRKVYERMGMLCRIEQQHLGIENNNSHAAEANIAPPEPAVITLKENNVLVSGEITMQVFWKNEHNSFSEQDSARQTVKLSTGLAQYTFELKTELQGIHAIRIDPSEQPGVFYLHSVNITSGKGDELVNWDTIRQGSSFQNLVVAKSNIDPNACILISLSGDPIIEITLPETAFAVSPYSACVNISISKMDEAFVQQELSSVSVAALKIVN